MEVDRSLRTARAAVFAAACVGVSAAGHVWMSGSTLPAWALLVALFAAGAAGYGLGGRQRGFASIAGSMLVGEFGLHLLFSAAQHATAGVMSPMAKMPDMPGIVMPHPVPASAWLCGGGRFAADASSGHGAVSSMPWMSAHGSAGMIAVHATAGLLCAWWLRRGEVATFRLLRDLARFAAPLLVIVWPAAPLVSDLTARVPEDSDEHAPTGWSLLVHAVLRRGPPAPVFCM